MSDHSNHMMSVEEARAVLELDSAPLAMRQAARTIVAQAEQNTRLQNALNEIEEWGINALEPMIGVGILIPGDMEDPEVSDE